MFKRSFINATGIPSNTDGHNVTVVKNLAKQPESSEPSIFGEVVRTVQMEMKLDMGNALDSAGDDPRTASNRFRSWAGNTLSMRAVIRGLSTVASTAVGTACTRNGDEPSSVSNRPSMKPNTVDGGSEARISSADADTKVNRDNRAGNGRQLNADFDSESTVIRCFIAVSGNAFRTSGDETVPSTEVSTDSGTRSSAPGGIENSPVRNWPYTRPGTSHSSRGLTVSMVSSELNSGCEMFENSCGESANSVTKLTTASGGNGTVNRPRDDVRNKMADFIPVSDRAPTEAREHNSEMRSSTLFTVDGSSLSHGISDSWTKRVHFISKQI